MTFIVKGQDPDDLIEFELVNWGNEINLIANGETVLRIIEGGECTFFPGDGDTAQKLSIDLLYYRRLR
jgi:hypothetical protein